MIERYRPTLDPSVRDAAVTAIKDKATALFDERRTIQQNMEELDRQLRRNEIAIFDCRGAARLFDADIELPEDLATARAVWVRRVMNEAPRPTGTAPAPTSPAARKYVSYHMQHAENPQPTLLGGLLGDGAPSVREIALQQLKRAGGHGTKSSVIRDVVESILKKKVHDKTVGMTLYRLSQEEPPRVRRDGQTWFFVPSEAETKNPGGSAPGSVGK